MVHQRESGTRRSMSYASVPTSDAAYHSFHDEELYEPASPSKRHTIQTKPPSTWKNIPFNPSPMRRQDSGYESIPGGSKSGGSPGCSRRTSTTSSSTSSSRPRTRPSIHRAYRSTPTGSGYSSGNAELSRPGSQRQQQQPVAYYHFPSPEGCMFDPEADSDEEDEDDDVDGLAGPAAYHPPPPQTTHYWTSDHTRRLEYAAIDAASQGVKGWMLRHVVPDCFIPKENRRLRFDDDTGSVRRYRLELDDVPEKEGRGRKLGWLFGRPSTAVS
ncbi:hypothetical protein PG993_004503 [Apiospora rasikravindrae]|uniref:Uncharacterized protein n=1 Tax=Apiospora rasikravindrae TaxID=990691 RepID=A0ABR1TFD7_9PEZI